jgi:uncharacterized membrane protein
MNTALNGTPRAPRMSRGMLALLVVSLCLNCLFIGGGAAAAVRWHLHPQEQVYRMALRRMTRRLDHDDAQAMRATLQEHRAQISAAWLDYRRALKPLAAALQETPRNEEHLRAAEQAVRTRRIALGDAVSDAVIAGTEKLSPAGRAALLKERGID